MKTLLLLFLSLCLSCIGSAREIQVWTGDDDDMKGDGRILDKDNPNLLGRGIDVLPGVVAANEAGLTVLTRKFPILQLSAEEEADPDLVTLSIESFQTSNTVGLVGGPQTVLVQGVIEYAGGSAVQGGDNSSLLNIGPGTTLDSRLIFDIGTGVQCSFPASGIVLSCLYTAFQPSGFTAAAVVGPTFRVNANLGYGVRPTTSQVTKTDILNAAGSLNPGLSISIPRPKAALELEATWGTWDNPNNSPAAFSFISHQGTTVWQGTLTNNQYPPPRLRWPADAVVFNFRNNAPGLMSNIEIKHYLAL